MGRIRYYICVRRLFVLIAGLTVLLSGCYTGSRPPRIGSSAPDFTVQDADRKVTLSDHRGKVVVLNFWATWCPPCVEETPSLVQMQQRLKDKGVEVVAVSLDVDESAYHKFLKDYRVNLLNGPRPRWEKQQPLRDFQISRDLHHRPQRCPAPQVYWRSGLEHSGDYGLPWKAIG